jgi:molybdenum cofactor biosynthesis protein B
MTVRVRRGPGSRAGRPPTAARRGHAAPGPRPVGCAIVTVSDTRGRADDPSGDLLRRRVERGGHTVVSRDWVTDDVPTIRRVVRSALARRDVDAILVTGGTGVAPRDVTPEAVAPLVQRWLPGFGELFRALSRAEVGSAAWLSRAAAGVARGRLLVILPGSPAAVRLAADRLLVPELAHVARLLGRFKRGE